jgi:Flp pilus assembly protein TadD
MAFSRTFWDNAVEAEVYALSSLIMAMAAWLILRWARWTGSRAGKTGLFLVLYYLVCLSMGIHLGTFLVLPGIILFALLVDRESFGSTPAEAWLVAGLVLLLHPGLLPTLRLWWGVLALGILVLVLLGSLGLISWKPVGRRGLLTWCLLLAVIGLSTHFYLMIRAHADPSINEADPETWGSLWKVLTRDQYKPASPFARQAPWSVQLTKHWLDYGKDQYALGLKPAWVGWLLPYLLGFAGVWRQASRDGKGFAKLGTTWLITSLFLVFYLNFRTDEVRPRDYFFTASYQFFAVWIGLGASWMVESARGWFAAPAGALPADAARADGDGGLAGGLVAGRERTGPGAVVAGALGLLLCGLPFLTANRYWFEHDRTGFWLARDFAWNMLTPLKPNAILFTNGDNDTFPLWYLQEVEGIRRDVRVANLSLLNTDWYMRQLRDNPPQIDLGWGRKGETDTLLAVTEFSTLMSAFRVGYIDQDGLERFLNHYKLRRYVRSLKESLLAKDVAVARIVEREFGRRPIYIALTVPEQMGLERRLVQRGIVLELEAAGDAPERIDAETTYRNLTEVFQYRGLLTGERESGRKFDTAVYKDENALRLVQNYAAAALGAAQDFVDRNRPIEADSMIALAGELSPGSPSITYMLVMLRMDQERWDEAEALLRGLDAQGVRDARLPFLLGRALEGQGRLDEAEAAYRRSLAVAPGFFDSMRSLFSLLWTSKKDRASAVKVLDQWVAQHPDDQRMRAARDIYAESLRILH